MRRRQLLSLVGTACVGGLAGCGSEATEVSVSVLAEDPSDRRLVELTSWSVEEWRKREDVNSGDVAHAKHLLSRLEANGTIRSETALPFPNVEEGTDAESALSLRSLHYDRKVYSIRGTNTITSYPVELAVVYNVDNDLYEATNRSYALNELPAFDRKKLQGLIPPSPATRAKLDDSTIVIEKGGTGFVRSGSSRTVMYTTEQTNKSLIVGQNSPKQYTKVTYDGSRYILKATVLTEVDDEDGKQPSTDTDYLYTVEEHSLSEYAAVIRDEYRIDLPTRSVFRRVFSRATYDSETIRSNTDAWLLVERCLDESTPLVPGTEPVFLVLHDGTEYLVRLEGQDLFKIVCYESDGQIACERHKSDIMG